MPESYYYGLVPISTLSGVGPKLAAKLKRLQLIYMRDLWLHFPLRYEDHSRITPMADLSPGTGSKVLVYGELVSCQEIRGKKPGTLLGLSDSTGIVYLRFYHFSPAQQRLYPIGCKLTAYAEVREGKMGYELYHPQLNLIPHGRKPSLPACLTPVYPTTEGLYQNVLRKFVKQALHYLSATCPETVYPKDSYLELPQHLIKPLTKPPVERVTLADALLYLHNPPLNADLGALAAQRHPMQVRVAFEEFLAHRLGLYTLRKKQRQYESPCLERDSQADLLINRFIHTLPFELTASQKKVFKAISADLAQSKPMLRLLQGDVGSGKTVVAALAALQAISKGYQLALMAPTEVLATQHGMQFERWFTNLEIKTGLLLGKFSKKQKRQCYSLLADGSLDLVVGTHALFQDQVKFKKLGLVIIDEQHKFGVHQRLALAGRNVADQSEQDDKQALSDIRPHQLVMTATPIPRTLAMTHYADLDISVIDQLPQGRQPIKTSIIKQANRAALIPKVMAYCQTGQPGQTKRQVYWVCPLIEESEVLQASAATSLHRELIAALPGLNIGLIHGSLSAQQKLEVMGEFKMGKIQILVATTVIEVGIDVPNANMMMIESAERLGLAQLHQLRGRIGRGIISTHGPAHCVLLYQTPLSPVAKERLSIMRKHTSGFAIAELDLKIRGAGEILGAKQTGQVRFHIADLAIHQDLLPEVKDFANHLINTHKHAQIKSILNFWLDDVHSYGHV